MPGAGAIHPICFPPIADIAVNRHRSLVADDNEILETASSLDLSCRWVLHHRADGRFDYAEYRYVDLRPDGHVDGYWQRSYKSGLFDTAQAARADALEAIPWLPGQL